jgi:hypothetical protein
VLDAGATLKSVRADEYHCALCAARYFRQIFWGSGVDVAETDFAKGRDAKLEQARQTTQDTFRVCCENRC